MLEVGDKFMRAVRKCVHSDRDVRTMDLSASEAGPSGPPCWKKFRPAADSVVGHGASPETAANCSGCVQVKQSTGQVKRKVAGGLADLEGAMGSFTSTTIDHRLPCTAAGEGGTCQIVGQLSTWNEFLCKAHLELREVPGTCSRLSLSACFRTSELQATREERDRAVTLAHWLLKTHRCVGAVHLPRSLLNTVHSNPLSRALQGSSAVKSLTLHLPILKLSRNFCGVLPSLTQLERSSVLTTASLTCLRIPKVHWRNAGEVRKFLAALEANSTLEELAVNDTLIEKASVHSKRAFEGYVRKSKTLTTLTIVASDKPCEEAIYCFLTNMGANDTLLKVNLVGFFMGALAATIASLVLERSKSLRSFNIIGAQPDYFYRGMYSDSYNSGCKLFAEMETLEEATLPVTALSKDQWPVFFSALAKNRNLRDVVIEVNVDTCWIAFEVYTALTESVAAEKVRFICASHPHYPLYSRITFPRGGFSEVYIGPGWDAGRGTELNREHLSAMICQLPLYTNVTSVVLDMRLSNWDDAMFSAFSHYVESTTTLRKLRVGSVSSFPFPEPDATTTTRFWTLLVCSLSQNESVTELHAESCVNEEVAKDLGDLVKTSANIRRVQVRVHKQGAAIAFIGGLSVAIADNYRLTDVTLYRAQALEKVSQSPPLMEEVAELASISPSEANCRVREGLKSFESLHGFMQLCGVVRDQVACHVRPDGHMQLDGLNEDCWNTVNMAPALAEEWLRTAYSFVFVRQSPKRDPTIPRATTPALKLPRAIHAPSAFEEADAEKKPPLFAMSMEALNPQQPPSPEPGADRGRGDGDRQPRVAVLESRRNLLDDEDDEEARPDQAPERPFDRVVMRILAMLKGARKAAVFLSIILGAVMMIKFLTLADQSLAFHHGHVFIRKNRLLSTLRAVCDSHACQEYAWELQSSLDVSCNPCHSLYGFVCGRWRRGGAVMSMRKAAEARMLQQVLQSAMAVNTSEVDSGSSTTEKVAALVHSCLYAERYPAELAAFLRARRILPSHQLNTSDLLGILVDLSANWGIDLWFQIRIGLRSNGTPVVYIGKSETLAPGLRWYEKFEIRESSGRTYKAH
ncbi:hypothetical protein HPB48_018210 [Haemaphysalis longicornis]|uniref:Uncharacterized protein n=1 Tax=Haemaphysalis longicornis TaxID=44386 RepID=A0A9J6GP25_HAELO|nr:hypothetical protein HPB48_018210 [Haemaphysalis longicornis]